MFEPFSVMGKRHGGAFCHALAKSLVRLTEDRAAQTIAELRDLLSRLDTRWGVVGLPKPLRPIVRGGILFALGGLEGLSDAPNALARADELEACGLRLYDMVASQIRANYYACQGAVRLAHEQEKQVEMHAVRNGSAWQAEAWAPSSKVIACIVTRDIIGLKQAAEELARLSIEIPSFVRVERLARTSLKALRGEYAAAVPALEQLLQEDEPRSHIGWGVVVGVLAWVYNETGQHERAATLCKSALAQLSEDDRLIVAINLGIEIQLALAEAGLERMDLAQRRLDELLAKHAPQAGAVTMGSLHQARAQVALLAGDRSAMEHSCQQTEHWFRRTGNPALIAQSERVVRLMLQSSRPPPADGEDGATVDLSPVAPSLLLAACSGPDERAQQVIDYAVRAYGADRGWLFGVRAGELALLAACGEQEAPNDMAPALRARIANMLEAQRTLTLEAEPTRDVLSSYTVVPLTVEAATPADPLRVLGALVLQGASTLAAPASDRFVRRFAEILYASADVSTLRMPG